MTTKNRWALCALVALALCLVAAFDVSAATTSHAVAMTAALAIPLDELPQLMGKLREKTEEVGELGKQLLADNEAGRKSSDELKQKLDIAMTEQGEVKQRMLDLEQAVAKGFKSMQDGPADELSEQLQKGWDESGIAGVATNPNAFRGKSVNIAISRKALTNTGVTGAALTYPGGQLLPQPLQPLLRRLTVRDLLAQGRTNKPVLFYQRESGYTNNAAPVSEGSLKPKSELTFELITEPVRTIAHLFDISLQMLDDVDYIQSYIESRGRYGLKLIEEAQLLTGSGTGQNLSGIYTEATAYAPPSGATINGAAAGGAGEQDLDKLRLALLQVELAEAFATGIVLHPTDWASIELLKDTTGQYLFTNPQNTTQGRIWGRDVVSTQAMTQGRFLVGDFAAHAQILDRQDANVAISFENKDNFERNMATIRIEERLALAIYRPEAFVKGVLESAS